MLIALMLEGVISHVLSLNFDLAPQSAAVELGVEVTVIDRPEPIPMTVVHLHGSVNSANDEWVLRAEIIDAAERKMARGRRKANPGRA